MVVTFSLETATYPAVTDVGDEGRGSRINCIFSGDPISEVNCNSPNREKASIS
jgi:hypothetical protein